VSILASVARKVCTKCGRDFPATTDYFHLHPRSPDGLKPRCKECRSLDSRREYMALPDARRQDKIAAAAAWGRLNKHQRSAYSKAYRKAHPEKYQSYCANRRARQRNVYVEDVDVAVLYERDGGRCGICGRKVSRDESTIDHIIPILLGGQHSYVNTQIAHGACNSSKGYLGPGQLRLWGVA
jgi:5-methylcytosine-specific restriction endonuclease McrA